MQDTKKAPLEAATPKSANVEHTGENHITKGGDWQGYLRAVTGLEAASLGLGMAESLCTLLAQGLGGETGGPMQPERVGMYADSLFLLADHLRTAKEGVQQDTVKLYQERRRAP